MVNVINGPISVYEVVTEQDQETVVYVGRTTQPDTWASALKNCSRKLPIALASWSETIQGFGDSPVVRVIHVTQDSDDAQLVRDERIEELREQGVELLNQ